MSTLLLDLIVDILSRLPVKDLLRFRCVSKTFRSLIDSSDFVKLHLNRSVTSHINQTLILSKHDLRVADLASLNSFSGLEHPLMGDDLNILGSCNGLLCISNILDDMAIWNLSMKKYIMLPSLSLGSYDLYVFGFGYDSVNDDYKVVRITQSGGKEGKPLESEVKVLSMGRKGWRRIEDIPYVLPCPGANGVFASGSLHWVVSYKDEPSDENVIVALDVGLEEYREVPQPEYTDNKKFRLDVGVLGGCLCLMANYLSHVDLWVMREYGVKESWSKLLSLACDDVVGSLRSMKPLAYSRSGDQVLLEQDNTNLVWYDLKMKKAKNVSASGMPYFYKSEICLQSLVSADVKKINDARRQQKGEDKKKDDFLSVGFKLVL
ncbi:hypothetical protein SLEP1_g25836 [Rubroshorea leprosula]|uniref:F-box domain-containing protein n=1 Tax=Rubroshorea leprosula TaxID=152421 RepID=A0AAV5JSE6_9ROSI|nr:hypothetical protein SLEP1_g25836 [Rubroshorea leprosula]